MPRFFIEESSVCGENIIVGGDDAVHIGRSLRMKIGDNITFCREGFDYETVIDKMTSDTVTCRIIEKNPISSEPRLKLTIYQALPKQDKPELIIQKTTELGASRIVFFLSKRCVSRPDEKSAAKKIQRYRKIAEEAAKQSGRGIIPEIAELMSFEQAAEDMMKNDIKLICYENGGQKLSDVDFSSAESCGVMIGAEGGFERREVNLVTEKGAVPIWLGKRILRCETCPIAMTALIMNLSGDM
ncbi:MAG: RsmE family RNA methyltransferase [Huintestinicola sp.]